ncbi:MAG: hypothetical protein QOE32_4618, partial [Pseudonocardiales bacterium]|nr:hypothetical protein [Pseudonocardiales bacterium]
PRREQHERARFGDQGPVVELDLEVPLSTYTHSSAPYPRLFQILFTL